MGIQEWDFFGIREWDFMEFRNRIFWDLGMGFLGIWMAFFWDWGIGFFRTRMGFFGIQEWEIFLGFRNRIWGDLEIGFFGVGMAFFRIRMAIFRIRMGFLGRGWHCRRSSPLWPPGGSTARRRCWVPAAFSRSRDFSKGNPTRKSSGWGRDRGAGEPEHRHDRISVL